MDNISVEELVVCAEGSGLKALHHLFNEVWEHEELPAQWKQAVIVPLHKDKLECSNYRGISLLCHTSKVFSSIILQRIKLRTEEILSEAQAGFRTDRSTVDQIFTLRQLAEKYEEFGKQLYVCYIDFRKAFDSIWRKGLWKVMRHLGYPEKIIRILENAYTGTFSAVRVGGDLSNWFKMIVGVLQGCVLSPLLFNIFLEVVTALATGGSDRGALIGGQLIENLRFADDIAMLAETAADLQLSVDGLVDSSGRMGMKINADKTETQFLGKGDSSFQIQIEGQTLKQSENFIYLGGNISSTNGCEGDVTRRIGLARGIFQDLNKIWVSKEISKATKIQVYESLVINTLLYNSETWTLKEDQKDRLRVLEMSFLRKIEGVTRYDRIRNTEIYARLHYHKDINQRIQQRRLRYFGHICRMQNERYPKIAMEGYVHGQRSRGRPKKRWIDTVRDDCGKAGLNLPDAKRLAMDRARWRILVDELPMRTDVSPRL